MKIATNTAGLTVSPGGTGKTGRRIAARLENLGRGVRALGRAPRDFADYVRDAVATGVWNTEAVR